MTIEGNTRQKEVPYDGKTFFITGAASGIGDGLARSASRRGAGVITFDISPTQSQSFTSYSGDISKRDDLTHVAEDFATQHTFLDCLVLSAGITQSHPGEVDREEEQRILNINAQGTINTFELMSPLLKSNGTVIFLSSDTINDPNPSLPTYTESKRRIAEYAVKVAKDNPNMRVLILLPGPIDTPLFRHGKNDVVLKRIDTNVGIMSPDDFADEVLNNIVPGIEEYPSGSLVKIYKSFTEKVSL